LEQWDRVFSYAQDLGLVLHFVTQETENELLLDDGDTGPQRQLYYRELVARFGHHPYLLWNLGEENGPAAWITEPTQSDAQRLAMIDWFDEYDPYEHPVIIHTHSDAPDKDSILDPLLGSRKLQGLSFQVNDPYVVHEQTKRWLRRADSSGQPWIIGMDEIGPWYSGSLDDATDPAHDTLRTEVLWGAYMAGAYGVEWYYGWHTPQHDLNAEDFRSRERLYDMSAAARILLETLPLEDMASDDEAVSNNAWSLATQAEAADPVRLIYVRDGATTTLHAAHTPGTELAVTYVDPVTGDQSKGPDAVAGDNVVIDAPANAKEWLVMIRPK